MTSFKCFESKPVVKIILIYDRLNLWRHRQFITIFYQFLHIRIEIIHGSHMYILFLPRIGLYVSFLPLAFARGKTSWLKALPVVKTIYTYGFHELFLNLIQLSTLSYLVVGVRVIVFNATFNNISVISWLSVLLVEETAVPSSSHNVVSSTPHLNGIRTHNSSDDRHWLHG